MYCLKNTLHSFTFCCDYISLKVMRASLGCWQRKCSLTFDRNVLDLRSSCDAHAVCSVWLIARLIKALSPSDPCQAFPSLPSPSHLSLPTFPSSLHLLPCPLSSVLASPPAFCHLGFCITSSLILSSLYPFQSADPVLTPSCPFFSLLHCLWCLFQGKITQPPGDPAVGV